MQTESLNVEAAEAALADKIRIQRVRFVFIQSAIPTFFSPLGAAVLSIALRNDVEQSLLVAWVVSLLVIAVARVLLVRSYPKVDPDIEKVKLWERAFVLSIMVVDVCWGVGALYLMPDDPALQGLVFAIVMMMTSGHASSFAAHPMTVILGALAIAGPITVAFILKGDAFHLVLATGAAMYLLAMLRSLHTLSYFFSRNHRLTQELEIANQSLRAHETVLEEWNLNLTRRVAEGIAEQERLSRLRRFFSPAVAERLVSDSADEFLSPRRREIVVVFIDLRGYTAFTEAIEADEVMKVLGEFHAAMGEIIMTYGGTLERFAGDGMMIFFNDPVEIPDPAAQAVAMAVRMQQRFADLNAMWRTRGYHLAMGIGIAQGLATLGAIGFEGRRDYGAIGSVTNLAARLCSEAEGGQILISGRAARGSEAFAASVRAVGEIELKGFACPQEVFEVGHV